MPVDVRILRGLPIFAELDDELVQQIAAIAQGIEFRAEERLFDVGERPRCVYVLRSGPGALGTHGPGGEFVAVEVCRTGDIFATPPVLLDRPSLMAATTLERCELVCIAASEFRELLRRDPSVAMAMVASIATGYRALVRQISDLKSR